MAVSAARLTVGMSPVALNTAAGCGERLTVFNGSANAADLGGPTVAAGAGYSLPANTSVSLELDPGDQVFAIRSAAADAVLSVLRT